MGNTHHSDGNVGIGKRHRDNTTLSAVALAEAEAIYYRVAPAYAKAQAGKGKVKSVWKFWFSRPKLRYSSVGDNGVC